ncbi:MAG: class I SAM-dependent methyltransferase [Ignavibacteriaceae bacterium]
MYKKFKQWVYRSLIPIIRLLKYLNWLNYRKTHATICLLVGAGKSKFNDWFNTDIHTLDVTNESDFYKYFSTRKINKILAEHVLEHLTDEQLFLMIGNFLKFSEKDINIRIAVPDGYHADKNYIDRVKPLGSGEGALDHKNLFTYQTLSELFEKHGFKSNLKEYWDENGLFHSNYQNDYNGFIERSFLNDERNKDGKPNYTSLIIDFTKK